MNTANDKLTIFYLDDDRDDLYFFEETLKKINGEHELHTTRAGQELLQLLESPPPHPHLIFVDLNMPGMDGFEVLDRIRNRAQSKPAPIIVFTTSQDRESALRCKDLGADMFVSKPDDYQSLEKVLKGLLKTNWSDPSSFKFHQ